MSDDYLNHVRRQDLKYTLAYEEFENSLSPEERALLGSAAAPDLESHNTFGGSPVCDLAESDTASYTPSMADACDGLEDELAEVHAAGGWAAVAKYVEKREEVAARRLQAQSLARVFGTMVNTGNAKLSAAGLGFALGISATNGFGTMAQYAASIGVSRQAVSKVAKQWQEELELPPSIHMRDEEVCQTYSEVQSVKHWRSKKCKKKIKLFR